MESQSRFYLSVFIIVLTWTISLSAALAAKDTWTPLGPYGGLVHDLSVSPTNDAIVYAVARFGGVYKTSNSGTNWNRLTNGLPEVGGYQFNCVLVLNSGRVLVGGDLGINSVYRSDDNGSSWTGVWMGSSPHRFALGSDGSVWAATDNGIYVSVDSGSSWSQDGLDGRNMVSVIVDPGNPSVLLAGSRGSGSLYMRDSGWSSISGGPGDVNALAMPNSAVAYAGNFDSAYRGERGGTWNFSQMDLDPSESGYEIMNGVDIAPGNPQYALAVRGFTVSETSDVGYNWTVIHRTSLDSNFGTVKYAPSNSNRAYVASGIVDVFMTGFEPGITRLDKDGLKSVSGWSNTSINSGITAVGINKLIQHPLNANHLWVATEHGVYRSKDGGASWTGSNGTGSSILEESRITAFAADPSDTSTAYAATMFFGLFKTTDGGTTWTPLTGMEQTHSIAVDPNKTADIYLATEYDVKKSENSGASFSDLDVRPGQSSYVYSLVIDPNNSGVVYCGIWGDAIYKTVNGGSSWNAAGGNKIPATSLAVAPSNSNLVFAGTQNEIWRSLNGGDSWTLLYSNTNWGDVTAIALDKSDMNAVYLSTRFNGVWVSGDKGMTWSMASGDLPELWIKDLVADNSTSKRLLIATGNMGVWVNEISQLPGGTRTVVGPIRMLLLD